MILPPPSDQPSYPGPVCKSYPVQVIDQDHTWFFAWLEASQDCVQLKGAGSIIGAPLEEEGGGELGVCTLQDLYFFQDIQLVIGSQAVRADDHRAVLPQQFVHIRQAAADIEVCAGAKTEKEIGFSRFSGCTLFHIGGKPQVFLTGCHIVYEDERLVVIKIRQEAFQASFSRTLEKGDIQPHGLVKPEKISLPGTIKNIFGFALLVVDRKHMIAREAGDEPEQIG